MRLLVVAGVSSSRVNESVVVVVPRSYSSALALSFPANSANPLIRVAGNSAPGPDSTRRRDP